MGEIQCKVAKKNVKMSRVFCLGETSVIMKLDICLEKLET